MKVIKKGRPKKGWSKEAICTGKGNGGGGCGAVLLVEQTDLFVTYNTDYKNDTDHYTTFECLECGVLTDIDCPIHWSKLPSQMLWEAGQKEQ